MIDHTFHSKVPGELDLDGTLFAISAFIAYIEFTLLLERSFSKIDGLWDLDVKCLESSGSGGRLSASGDG